MTDIVLNKIQSLLQNSASFGILLEENMEEEEFLLKEALKLAFLSRNIPILSLPEDPQTFRKKWSSLVGADTHPDFPKKTSLKLPKNKYLIKDVVCKEETGVFSIIVTSPNTEIAKEDIAVEVLPPEVEAVFCFFGDEEKIEKFKNKILLPEKEKMIFITANKKTTTEKIKDILDLIDPALSERTDIATLLYAALVTETAEFSEKTTPNTLETGKVLLENGAKKEAVSAIRMRDHTYTKAQLMGRVLARTYTDESLGISWSFLNSRDIQKTGNNPVSVNFLYDLLKKVRLFLPPQNLYILLWQTIEGVRAVFISDSSKSEDYLKPFADRLGVQLQSRFFTAGPFENFTQAEISLREPIKEEIKNILNNYLE